MTRVHVLPVLLLIGAVAGARPSEAQSQPSGLEVGAQFSMLRLTDFDATNAGFGGRASFDLSPWLAVEGEMNFFPRDRVEVKSSPALVTDLRLAYSRRRLEGFVGPKIGIRRERFGLFAKVQPGFARLTHKGLNCIGNDCARVLFLLALPAYRTELAANVGGVLEFYPSAGTVARVDLGSTMIRHRSAAPPCADCTSRNFSSSVGVGLRF